MSSLSSESRMKSVVSCRMFSQKNSFKIIRIYLHNKRSVKAVVGHYWGRGKNFFDFFKSKLLIDSKFKLSISTKSGERSNHGGDVLAEAK